MNEKSEKKLLLKLKSLLMQLMQLISLIHKWLKYNAKEFVIVFYVNI